MRMGVLNVNFRERIVSKALFVQGIVRLIF